MALNESTWRGYAGAGSVAWRSGYGEIGEAVPPDLVRYLGLPHDLRGLSLAFGALGAVVLGLALLASGDLTGLAYIAAGVVGYLFLHARLLAVGVWAAIAIAGLWGLIAGNPTELLQVILATALAVVAGMPAAAPRPTSAVSATGPLARADEAADDDPAREIQEPAMAEPAAIDAEAPEAVLTIASSPAQGPTRLRIQTLGSLQILDGDSDLTSVLLGRPVLAFMWLYHLARALRTPGDRLSRSALADEMSPGLPRKQQQIRVRSQLYDLRKDLPPALAAMVQATRQSSGMSLEGVELDVELLRLLDARVSGHDGLLDAGLAAEIEGALGTGDGEFLPEFDDLAQRVTGAAGIASSVVDDVRRQVDGCRANLTVALADGYLARRQPEKAISVLERARARAEDREDLKRRLVEAYMQTGQTDRATELRHSHQLPAEV